MDELSRIFQLFRCLYFFFYCLLSLLLLYHEFFTSHQSLDQLNAKALFFRLLFSLHRATHSILNAMFIIVLAWPNSTNQFVCSWTFLFGCVASIVIRIEIERQSRYIMIAIGTILKKWIKCERENDENERTTKLKATKLTAYLLKVEEKIEINDEFWIWCCMFRSE